MLTVAVICKANLFRSPAARVFLADAFGSVGIEAVVTSGGILEGGASIAPAYLAIALESGLDLSDHVSHTISPFDLVGQDLVLTMTRELLREVVVLEPSIWQRAFTMREFLRRASSQGARKPTESLEHWIGAIAAPRTRSQVLGDLEADDVADPVGGTAEDYRVMLRQLERLSKEIAALF
jgi:protein-tyrosine phosphatase